LEWEAKKERDLNGAGLARETAEEDTSSQTRPCARLDPASPAAMGSVMSLMARLRWQDPAEDVEAKHALGWRCGWNEPLARNE
jgi:hypothetical protein